MKLILLSGGSGKRLWPLSNDSRSKQFLKVLENSEGKLESMVQRVWRQLSAIGLADSAIIATSKSQIDMIHSQIGTQVPVIIEPERRDTFPAIALAASYLFSKEDVSPEEVVAVLPVDSFVEEKFFTRILELEKVLKASGADLALVGVSPTYPSEKYGYIIPNQTKNSNSYVKVKGFKEKPTENVAKELIQHEALWNCGVFAFKLDYLVSLLLQKGLPIQYEELLQQYGLLPKISFDYEVVEKAQEIVAIRYDGAWKDLGTWNTLTEEMATNQIGVGIISKESDNTHLINELDIPVAVLGLSNVVVAASPDGILVSDKAASPRIKEIIAGFDRRPMYEERRWGWYRVLDYTKFEEGREVLTKRIGVIAGKNLSYQLHHKRSEVWTIISGIGEFVLNDTIYEVKPGDVLQIPVGSKHGIKAIADLEFIEVQTGSELIEEDIIRIYMTWEDVMEHCQSTV
ncbi:mannose-1-phosphate guanylyltransferase [Fodinisporobacter ferrooxydans]|uniref:Mannose-1-phosphate guanylyltransferase n=1 Tax=Fodinisporobacter ferrooxydans TaxID=2901836 RepID=A0ABY4CUA8_9BACL|nr:mannose-1-phosphate guanylyltransferase [Alicyclobacillaceae bacterium MYW30-H2]